MLVWIVRSENSITVHLSSLSSHDRKLYVVAVTVDLTILYRSQCNIICIILFIGSHSRDLFVYFYFHAAF